MTQALADTVTISGGALIALVVLGIVELGLVIFCIVDIVRRPAVTGGHKWVWIVLVLLFNLIGSILYLAIGRAQPPAAETRADPDPEAAARGRAAAAADLLYGPAGAADAPASAGADASAAEQETTTPDGPPAPEAPEPPAGAEHT
jgi:hypothetical protein